MTGRRSLSLAFAAVLIAGLSATAWAGFKEGERAFDKGDYAEAAAQWRPLAEDGDARAQTNLGHLYRLGQGVERDYAQALKWYRRAADQGSTRAQANLGNMYIKGFGVDADPVAGVALFRQSAELGFAVAQLLLGDFYRLGEVVVFDLEQAALWYRRAAKQGHPEAALRLGRLYLAGAGVDTDEAAAARWLREAAAFGLAVAQYELAELYRRGRGVERDLKEAMNWYHAAAAQGHVGAVGRLAANGADSPVDDPNHQLRVAAEVGDAAAQMRLATLLREGGQMPRNATAALEWYRRAAAQGHARASYNLGMMYHDGDGVEADDVMAAAWFRRAAGLDESDAQYTLGVYLSKGIGGAADPEEARQWFLRAARQGDSRAQYSLGVMHEKGAGGAVDLNAAMKWYGAAAEQGDQRAHERFAALTVETAAPTPSTVDLEPVDSQAEKALDDSAAAALDALERLGDAVDEAAGELAVIEPEKPAEEAIIIDATPTAALEPEAPAAEAPTAALEPEAPATVEAMVETIMETPPQEAEPEGEAETEGDSVTVIVTTGTGVTWRVDSLVRGDSGADQVPVIEFNWFGDDSEDEIEADETASQEVVAVPELAIQQGEEETGVTEPETDLEAATETVTLEPEAEAVGQAIATGSGESPGTETPSGKTGKILLIPIVDPDEPAEDDARLPSEPVAADPATTMKDVDWIVPTIEFDLFGGFERSTDDSWLDR